MMLRTDHTTNRMGDVVLALSQAGKARIHPTRIQLQKFIYLSDVLGQVVGALMPVVGHKTYFNGPYDSAIQNAVDSLAFRGLVQITGVWKTPSGKVATKYTLAISGEKFLARLQSAPGLARKIQVADLVGCEINKLGWARIVDLVYAEPTFVSTRPTGWGSRLNAEDGLSVSAAFVVAIMKRLINTLYVDQQVTPEWIADRFFAYLDDYDRNYGSKSRGAEV